MLIKACASFLAFSVLAVYSESSYAGHGLRKVHTKEYEKAQKKKRDQARDLKYEANFPATVAPSAIEVADDEAEQILDRIRNPEKYDSPDEYDEYDDEYYSQQSVDETGSEEEDSFVPHEEFYSRIAFDRLNAYRQQMDDLTSESRIMAPCIERLQTLGGRVEKSGWTLQRALTLSGCIKQMQDFDRDFKRVSRGYRRLKTFLNRKSDYLIREVQVMRLNHRDFLVFKQLRKIWSRTRRYKKQMKALLPEAQKVLQADREHRQRLMDLQMVLNLSSETVLQFKNDRVGSLNESE